MGDGKRDLYEVVKPAMGYGCGDFDVMIGEILEAGHRCAGCWVAIGDGSVVAVITDEVGDQAIYHEECLPGKYGFEGLTA